jgi:hypothetical protein
VRHLARLDTVHQRRKLRALQIQPASDFLDELSVGNCARESDFLATLDTLQ